jgi:transposase
MERALLVIMHKLGFSTPLIVQWSGHTLRTIRHWITHFEQHGEVLDEPRRGRPRATTQELDEAIISIAEEQRFVTPRMVRNQLRAPVSTRTIRNRLDEAGLFGRVARISYPYTEEHIDKRLQFANDYAGWDGNDWSTVLFCDEAHIWLGGASQIWVQRPEDTAFLDEYMIHGGARHARISVWAGFSALGLTRIHVVEGNLDSTKLIGIFSAELIQYARRTWPDQAWNLLQDNSPIHNADDVQDWLDDKGVIRFDFPKYSPDLNPMENLWASLKREVEKDFPTNIEELTESVRKCWSEIPLELLLVLASSMTKRLEAVRVVRGFRTKY